MLTNSRLNKYTNSFTYDSIGNILSKEQVNIAKNPATGAETAIPSLTYTLSCQYNAAQPHAVSFDGNRTYTCDQNGNMTGYASADNREWRKLYWDDENRLTKSEDNAGTVEYAYDDAGIRTKKKSPLGETLYVNANYSVRNGEVYSKHIFAGNTRLATKMEKRKGTGAPTDLGLYYYHGDHLGSSNAITNGSGNFHEHVEYFPYGETWVEERVAGGENLPHKFTGKELDPETNLYYYGARYYDPQLSRWVSADPILDKYLPTGNTEKDGKLPGIGGVFNTVNLNIYHYAGNNPIVYTDPNGKEIVTAVILIGMGAYALIEAGWNMYQIHKLKGEETTGQDYMVAGSFGVMTGTLEGAITFGSAGILAYPAAAQRGALTDIVMQRLVDSSKDIDLVQVGQKATTEVAYRKLASKLPISVESPLGNVAVQSTRKIVDKTIKSEINKTITGVRSGSIFSPAGASKGKYLISCHSNTSVPPKRNDK